MEWGEVFPTFFKLLVWQSYIILSSLGLGGKLMCWLVLYPSNAVISICLTEEYVTCHTCRSPDTILQKETRLFFIQCETCGSRRSVASIKSGFQAITQKRAQLKSKQQ